MGAGVPAVSGRSPVQAREAGTNARVAPAAPLAADGRMSVDEHERPKVSDDARRLQSLAGEGGDHGRPEGAGHTQQVGQPFAAGAERLSPCRRSASASISRHEPAGGRTRRHRHHPLATRLPWPGEAPRVSATRRSPAQSAIAWRPAAARCSVGNWTSRRHQQEHRKPCRQRGRPPLGGPLASLELAVGTDPARWLTRPLARVLHDRNERQEAIVRASPLNDRRPGDNRRRR
jgi:hypothetical protein